MEPPASESSALSVSKRQYRVTSEELGSGTFGVVFRGYDSTTGGYVAIKTVSLGAKREGISELKNEYELLKTLAHKNVVKVIDFIPEESDVQIVMEWLPSGSVQQILSREGIRLHEGVIRRYLRDTLEGLAFLHKNNVIHRDIKPGNMLVAADGTVKLSDFGTAKNMMDSATTATMRGTPRYLAPECIKSMLYTDKSDIWAVGCAAVHMSTAAVPWADHVPPTGDAGEIWTVTFRIGSAVPPNHHPSIPGYLSTRLKDIIAKCFSYEREARPSAEELLRDSYFTDTALPQDAEDYEHYHQNVFCATHSPTKAPGSGDNSSLYMHCVKTVDSEPSTVSAPSSQGDTRKSEEKSAKSDPPTTTRQLSPPQPPLPRPPPPVQPPLLFQYEQSGQYCAFPDGASHELSQKFYETEGRGKVRIAIHRAVDRKVVEYIVNFEKHEQVNTKTGFRRNVRWMDAKSTEASHWK